MQPVERRVWGGVCALCLLALALPAHAKPKQRKAEAAATLRVEEQPEPPKPEPAEPPPPPAAEEPPPPAASTATQPPAAEPATSGSAAPVDPEQLAALQAELNTLMDDMVQARTRAALIGKTLFKTLVRVHVQNLVGDDTALAKIVLKLDGAPIFRGDAAAMRGDEARQVFEGFVAPGPHVLSAELEQNSKNDQAYGYTLRESYKFQALRDKRNELSLTLRDSSDMASEFPDDQDGEYDIRIRLRARTRELNEE
jgi:type IV secretory pathway VirB10-like protein